MVHPSRGRMRVKVRSAGRVIALIGPGSTAMVRPPRMERRCGAVFQVLGRSQVVRQRILIPPSGGSNPPAPANVYKDLDSLRVNLSSRMSAPCRHGNQFFARGASWTSGLARIAECFKAPVLKFGF